MPWIPFKRIEWQASRSPAELETLIRKELGTGSWWRQLFANGAIVGTLTNGRLKCHRQTGRGGRGWNFLAKVDVTLEATPTGSRIVGIGRLPYHTLAILGFVGAAALLTLVQAGDDLSLIRRTAQAILVGYAIFTLGFTFEMEWTEDELRRIMKLPPRPGA